MEHNQEIIKKKDDEPVSTANVAEPENVVANNSEREHLCEESAEIEEKTVKQEPEQQELAASTSADTEPDLLRQREIAYCVKQHETLLAAKKQEHKTGENNKSTAEPETREMFTTFKCLTPQRFLPLPTPVSSEEEMNKKKRILFKRILAPARLVISEPNKMTELSLLPGQLAIVDTCGDNDEGGATATKLMKI